MRTKISANRLAAKKKKIQQINSNLGINIMHVSRVGKELKIMLLVTVVK